MSTITIDSTIVLGSLGGQALLDLANGGNVDAANEITRRAEARKAKGKAPIIVDPKAQAAAKAGREAAWAAHKVKREEERAAKLAAKLADAKKRVAVAKKAAAPRNTAARKATAKKA